MGRNFDLSGTLALRTADLRAAVVLLSTRCGATTREVQGSLASGGLVGVRQDPQMSLPALYFTDRDIMIGDRLPAERYALARPEPSALRANVTLQADCGA